MADYTGQNSTENRFDKITGRPASAGSGVTDKSDYIMVREHSIYTARKAQLSINLLGLDGGQPYIDARLSRFAAETNTAFNGGTREGAHVTGRKHTAHCKPHMQRIVAKLNQYVFGESPVRDGLDSDLANNITRDGLPINTFMQDVNSDREVCGWAWVGVDMPEVADPGKVSILTKKNQKIRPYWVGYSPLEVVDWQFDSKGDLEWVLTQGNVSEGNDPAIPRITKYYRTLWQHGMATRFYGKENDKTRIDGHIEYMLHCNRVPFRLLGVPSAKPIIWDSIESINRTIMDLESALRENYFRTCYPQMYLPLSAVKAMAGALKKDVSAVTGMVIGMGYPILIGQGDTPPGYITPDANIFGSMRSEIDTHKRDLFDTVGFMLQKGSASAESAEAKKIDRLDIEAVLKKRANELEETEIEVVKISREFDETFPEYVPSYPKKFNIDNLMEDVQALVLVSNTSGMPNEMRQIVLKKMFDTVRKIGGGDLTPEQIEAVTNAIMKDDGLQAINY